jgi:hypothetical protein
MLKKDTNFPYSDRQAFDRLILLIATLIHNPGVGYSAPDSFESKENEHHNAIKEVQTKLWETAKSHHISLPEGYPALPTIRKDLEYLRQRGILDKRMYRWGYYLGTGVMSLDELQLALNALSSQAKYQGDAQSRRIYETVTKRLKGIDLDNKGKFLYPIRQTLNRAVGHTDPEEMIRLGENQNNLFHKIEAVESAIMNGQAIEIHRTKDSYGTGRIGYLQVFPLQLIYYDIAWYIIYEYCDSNHLAIRRVNRFTDYCKVLSAKSRSISEQHKRLQDAHKLREHGWGLYLGGVEEQKQELAGNSIFETVKVRFFPPVTDFIMEGERRHTRHKIIKGSKDKETGQPTYVDYVIKLPERSFKEFSLWVFRHMNHAQIMAPSKLVQVHRDAAQKLLARYLENTENLATN